MYYRIITSKYGNSMLNKLYTNGFQVLNIKDLKALEYCKKEIKKKKLYKNINNEHKFFKEVLNIQNIFFKKKIHWQIVKSNIETLKKIFKVRNPLEDLSITSFLHLRAVRPSQDMMLTNDNIGMHRESFYNRDLYVKHQVNVTVPIMNYSKKNSMKVVCKSHKIPDSKIKTKKISSKESGVKKKSLKHRLGSPYNPKKILSGVNLNSAKRLNIYPGKFCMFSAYLIHGGGTNPTKNIRLSLDFALIKNTKLNNLKVKKQFNSYSADRSYFQKLSTLYK